MKDLSFENPNAPAVYQWQGQPQIDVQFNIGAAELGDDIHEVALKIEVTADAEQGTAFQSNCSMPACSRCATCRRAAPALPARRGAAPALPVRPPDHRRGGRRTAASRRCCSIRSISASLYMQQRRPAAGRGDRRRRPET